MSLNTPKLLTLKTTGMAIMPNYTDIVDISFVSFELRLLFTFKVAVWFYAGVPTDFDIVDVCAMSFCVAVDFCREVTVFVVTFILSFGV